MAICQNPFILQDGAPELPPPGASGPPRQKVSLVLCLHRLTVPAHCESRVLGRPSAPLDWEFPKGKESTSGQPRICLFCETGIREESHIHLQHPDGPHQQRQKSKCEGHFAYSEVETPMTISLLCSSWTPHYSELSSNFLVSGMIPSGWMSGWAVDILLGFLPCSLEPALFF